MHSLTLMIWKLHSLGLAICFSCELTDQEKDEEIKKELDWITEVNFFSLTSYPNCPYFSFLVTGIEIWISMQTYLSIKEEYEESNRGDI